MGQEAREKVLLYLKRSLQQRLTPRSVHLSAPVKGYEMTQKDVEQLAMLDIPEFDDEEQENDENRRRPDGVRPGEDTDEDVFANEHFEDDGAGHHSGTEAEIAFQLANDGQEREQVAPPSTQDDEDRLAGQQHDEYHRVAEEVTTLSGEFELLEAELEMEAGVREEDDDENDEEGEGYAISAPRRRSNRVARNA